MEELTAQLAADFSVSSDPNSTAAAHPRFSQYKSRNNVVDQDERRQRILKAQKKQRFDYLQHIRCLSDETWDKADAESVASNDSMEIQVEEEEVRLRKPGRYYRNQLMLSEWLVEVPSDFETEWLAVLCPWGKRSLVVASKGKTCAYTRSGYKVNTFSSHLPGGSQRHYKDNAILDCLYNEVDGTFYIIDIMCWKNHPVYDSETEFRFFWLQSKLAETPELSTKSDYNPFKFIALPSFPCTQKTIAEAVNSAAFEIDGLLFFHKRTHYTFGSTPLVVWLKPYMLPEILNIEIADNVMSKKPDSYTTYAAHMENVAAEKAKAKETRRHSGDKKGVKIQQQEKGPIDGAGDREQKPQGRGGRRDRNKGRQGRQAKMDVMYSEWVTAIPEDLNKNWITVVCPRGKRNLVIAAQGRTYTQNKEGYLLDDFSSFLPGGHSGDIHGMAVLDCIFSKKDSVFYILDALVWKEQELTSCEAEFRFFWVKERMADVSGITRISKNNQYKFVCLQNCPSTKQAISKALCSAHFEVDGLLFYHKKVLYVPGVSEFVLWLKPYMLPEALGIGVPQTMADRPRSYKGFAEHVAEVEEESKQKGEENKKGRSKKKEEKNPPVIDIDKITMEIAALNLNKKEREENAIGPVHPRNMTYASVWKKEQDSRHNIHRDYYDGCAGDCNEYSAWYGGHEGWYDHGWYGPQGAVPNNHAWGFEDHKRRRSRGRGAMLLAMQDYKKNPMNFYKRTHQTFEK